MSTKIGPIQTGEEKAVAFDFSDEGVSGSLVSASVTGAPSGVLVGTASIDGVRVVQKVKYDTPDVTYTLQATATDSAGFKHTVSAYLRSKAVA